MDNPIEIEQWLAEKKIYLLKDGDSLILKSKETDEAIAMVDISNSASTEDTIELIKKAIGE